MSDGPAGDYYTSKDDTKIRTPQPNYNMTWTSEDGTQEHLSLDENGELLYNGELITNGWDSNKVLAILFKGLCSLAQK